MMKWVSAMLSGVIACSIAEAASGTYPNRPIRYIVAAASGGAPDTVARLIANELTRELGQQIVVDNRPGASGTIGMNLLARATPDGYTIGHANILNVAIVRSSQRKLPYDPRRDLRMIAQINTAANILATTQTLPVKSVPGLIEHARRNPGKLNYAYGAAGATGHLGMELFKLLTGTDIVGVAYASPARGIAELIAGHTHVTLENIAVTLPHIRAGRVRGLGISTLQRLPAVPDLPSVADTLPGFELIPWAGVAVPANTPDAVVRQLNAAVNKALANPAVGKRFRSAGLEPVGGTPEQFAALVEKEAAKWADVIKRSGVKFD